MLGQPLHKPLSQGNNILPPESVNTPVKKKLTPPPTLAERLRFAVWLSGATVGVESAAELAGVLKKGSNQLSDWVRGAKRPSADNLRQLAEVVKISAAWLDNPDSVEAAGKEPVEFYGWVTAQRERAKIAAAQRKRA